MAIPTMNFEASASLGAGGFQASASIGASIGGGLQVSARFGTPDASRRMRLPADPFMAFRFLVEVDGLDQHRIGGFSDVTGLAATSAVETFREGGVNAAERQLLGPTKFPSHLTLKRGMADKQTLWGWYAGVMRGEIVRRNVRIVMLSPAGERSMQWTFADACPVGWTGPELHAATPAVAFESVELVHRGFLA